MSDDDDKTALMCPLFGCTGALLLSQTWQTPLHIGDTLVDLEDADSSDTSWSVECEYGHVVLLPDTPHSADAVTEFTDNCEECNDMGIEHDDIARLDQLFQGRK